MSMRAGLAAVAVAAGLSGVNVAHACRCVEPGAGVAYGRADAVALVRVEALHHQADATVTGTAQVERAWKSTLPARIELVSGEDCVYPMREGGRYLLYLTRASGDDGSGNGPFGTFRCRGNLAASGAAPRQRWLDRKATERRAP